jgi:NADPH:quinone reductase-like Zn-dependent oxidoreductase
MALLPGGGHAELVAVHESHVLPVPDSVGWPEAGGFVEVFATAHDALFTQAGLMPGERLLVNGAAGGVGIAGVQLGAEAGATVTGSARHHLEQVIELGASDTTPSGNYSVILELVGGDNLRTNLERLDLKGRIALIGLGAGGTAEVNFHRLLRARGRIHGSTLRSRTRAEKAEVIRRLRDEVIPLLTDGRVVVPVHATYPLDQAQEAYDAFAAGGKFGKIVLVP